MGWGSHIAASFLMSPFTTGDFVPVTTIRSLSPRLYLPFKLPPNIQYCNIDLWICKSKWGKFSTI